MFVDKGMNTGGQTESTRVSRTVNEATRLIESYAVGAPREGVSNLFYRTLEVLILFSKGKAPSLRIFVNIGIKC